MNKLSKFAQSLANMFAEVGKACSLSIPKEYKSDLSFLDKSDKDALKEDWEAVGKSFHFY